MNILIAEDEELALERLLSMLQTMDDDIQVVATTDTKRELKELLLENNNIDLLLLDIELSDGKSLELFEEIAINIPVIFITAYDQYAIEAFKHLSFGYLLKPIILKDLKTALAKISQLKSTHEPDALPEGQPRKVSPFKEKLLLKIGNKYLYRDVKDALYFFADDKDVYMVSKTDQRKYPIDLSLDSLGGALDPSIFFRISRKYIVHIETIKELRGLSNVRLEIHTDHALQHKLYVSRGKVKAFKTWLNR